MFTIYIPPDFGSIKRFEILKELTYQLDGCIKLAKGLNHVVISGDFNQNGMKDMEIIAKGRGLRKVAMETRGDSELDAIYVSESVELIKQQA